MLLQKPKNKLLKKANDFFFCCLCSSFFFISFFIDKKEKLEEMMKKKKEKEDLQKSNTLIAMHTDSNQELLVAPTQDFPADESQSFLEKDILSSPEKSENTLDAASVPPPVSVGGGVEEKEKKKRERLEPVNKKRLHQTPRRFLSSELLLPPIFGTTDFCVLRVIEHSFTMQFGMMFFLEWDYRLPTGNLERTWEPVENVLTCQPMILEYTRKKQIFCNGVSDEGIAEIVCKKTGNISSCKPGISTEEIQKMFDPVTH
jgi:hypothetical protein